MICGRSGSGKSTLGLTLMAYGCRLVADDRTVLESVGGKIIASAHPNICGRIEARHIGILEADPLERAEVVLAVDLDHAESGRLPEPRHLRIGDQELPLLHKVDSPAFAPAILQYLKSLDKGRDGPDQ